MLTWNKAIIEASIYDYIRILIDIYPTKKEKHHYDFPH